MAQHKLSANQIASLMVERLLQHLEVKSNASNPTYQVDINSGVVDSDDGSAVMEVSSPITVDITASGANGLDTGSEASSTWYYLFLIYNPTTDTVAGLFSTSSTSPTMPSGYTAKRLISAVRNDGSSNLLSFYQTNYEYSYYAYYVVLASGSASTFTEILLTNYVPSMGVDVECWWSLASPAGAWYTANLSSDNTNIRSWLQSNGTVYPQAVASVKTPLPDSTKHLYYQVTPFNAGNGTNVYVQSFTMNL